MTTETFEDRLSQLERALKVIGTIESNPELQASSFRFLFGGASHPKVDAPAAQAPSIEPSITADAVVPSKKNGNGGVKRSAKTSSVAQDKTLQIAPPGKKSWVDFVEEKKPTNLNDKNTLAVYWLLEEAELTKVGISQVVTLFIAAKWALPANPRNSAQVAGSAGYLDTSDADEIKLTSSGTALVLNDLPRKPKK